MSLDASASVVIKRPVDEVFQFLADAKNQKRWQQGLRKVRQTGSGQGATVTERRAVMGRRNEYQLTIAEFQQNAKIVYEGKSTVQGHDADIKRTVTVQPTGSSGSNTRVTWEVSVDAQPLRDEEGRQGEAVAERMLHREIDKSLQDLKDFLEAPQAAQVAARHLPEEEDDD